LNFGASRRNYGAAARFAVCLRQEGSDPALVSLFLFPCQMRVEAETLPEFFE
jgi:hypothetical protein